MDGAIPVFRVSGVQALMIFLIVTVMFGAAHLAAISFPDSRLSKAWVLLGF